jgi:hypothetical protein
MGTVYNFAKQQPDLYSGKEFFPRPGGVATITTALVDPGKPAVQLAITALSSDEVNALVSKLDMICQSVENQAIANMIAEEIRNIILTVQLVKYQTQSSFAGILAFGTQLDIWPLRPKDVGGAILNVAVAGVLGLYGGVGAGVFSWYTAVPDVAGVARIIIPVQQMIQYGGMIYLGSIEKIYTPKVGGVQFTLGGIAAPAQPVTTNWKKTFGDESDITVSRLEKPVIIPPLKTQTVSVMPDVSGASNFEFIAFVVGQAQAKVF